MPVSEERVAEIKKLIEAASSATAAVVVVRKYADRNWDLKWGADALLVIAKLSTTQTRKEWAKDNLVLLVSGRLINEVGKLALQAREEATSRLLAGGSNAKSDASEFLLDRLASEFVALEALRRMGFQTVSDQTTALKRAHEEGSYLGWNAFPAKILARFLWLAAPLPRSPSPALSLVRPCIELGRCKEDLCPAVLAQLLVALRYNSVRPVKFYGKQAASLHDVRFALPPEEDVDCDVHEGSTNQEIGDFRGHYVAFDFTPAHGAPSALPNNADAIELLRFTNCMNEGDAGLPSLWFGAGSAKLLLRHGGVPHARFSPRSSETERQEDASSVLTTSSLSDPDPAVVPVSKTSRIALAVGNNSTSAFVNGKEMLVQERSPEGVPNPALPAILRIFGGAALYQTQINATIANAIYRPLVLPENFLLDRLVKKFREEKSYKGLTCLDIIDIADAFAEMGIKDKDALRALGSEILQRRSEFTAVDMWKFKIAFQTCGLPLDQVWGKAGAKRTIQDGIVVTVQAFNPQQGLEKKRRGVAREIARVSPPRSPPRR